MHSIVDGIAIGFISYALFHIAVGKWREVKPLFLCRVASLRDLFRDAGDLIRTNEKSPLRTLWRAGGLFRCLLLLA